VKLTVFLASLLIGSTALAQTAPAAPEAAPAAPPAAAPAAPAPAVAAPAPAAKPAAPAFTFALHGFVSMSAALQNGQFLLSEGQQSLASATAANPVFDRNSLNFDVRQSRFNFSVKGPQVLGGATPTAVMELDFMQGFGPGNFGEVSLLNRLRVLYSELNWGNHKLQLGQQNDLIFALAPTSLSHIAFPLGYFTGNIGWRRPGVFGYHTVEVDKDVKVEGAWEVGRSQWADTAACVAAFAPTPVTTVASCSGVGGAAAANGGGINLGEASAGPAVEGRVTVSHAKYGNVFVGAHWNNVDLTGYGAKSGGQALGTTHTIAVVAYNAGVKFAVPLPNDMGLTLQGTGFVGKNLQPLIASFDTGTGPITTTNNVGVFRLGTQDNPDVNSSGWWAQAGLNFTKEFSFWGFYGMQEIDHKDFVRSSVTPGVAARYANATTNLIAMYRDGGYGLSLEWINFKTKVATKMNTAPDALTITDHRISESNQFMATANYFF
jgi:hypothetical protein